MSTPPPSPSATPGPAAPRTPDPEAVLSQALHAMAGQVRREPSPATVTSAQTSSWTTAQVLWLTAIIGLAVGMIVGFLVALTI